MGPLLVDDKHHGRCCIYEVPDRFKYKKEDILTPTLFSIGPIHYGRVELAPMEEQKKIYYEKFCGRIPEKVLENFELFLQGNESYIQKRYYYAGGTCPLQMDEFRRLVLNDSIFIVELLLGYHEETIDGFLNDSLEKDVLIRKDLLLLENQLPYLILEELYDLVSSTARNQTYPSLLNLCCKFFGFRVPKKYLGRVQVHHFTDLARSSFMGILPLNTERVSARFLSLPSVKRLRKIGVNLKSIQGGYIDSMKLISVKFLWFEFFEFQIPHVEVNILSECVWQNIRALEFCAYESRNSHVTNFLYLVNCLMGDEEEADMLVSENIISNNLSDDNVGVFELFVRVQGEERPHSDRDVWGICERLRALQPC